ncbi:hypothetical protein [Cloacibacillus sp.]|uniref:hypothetical protein n=1 Tax=Cloacibacillus sp. TaxID=2049023 RepID=UPI0025BFB493|nr:hypothetical protein [Cloacibacillus sp.]MCC8057174.1 hypothetical protein [Cloacibacillus sp.]
MKQIQESHRKPFALARLSTVVFLCLLVFAMLPSSVASAAWTLNGTWDYTANVPAQRITIGGNQFDFRASENGVIVMDTVFVEDKEFFNTYVISGTGHGAYKLPSNSSWTEDTYNFGPATMQMKNEQYDPAKELTVSLQDPIDVWGYKVSEWLVLKQTGENTVSGTIYLDCSGTLVTGTVSATRRGAPSDSGGGGGCNAGVAGIGLMLALAVLAVKRKFL